MDFLSLGQSPSKDIRWTIRPDVSVWFATSHKSELSPQDLNNGINQGHIISNGCM